MQGLDGWGDASAIILSCPGPWRRHDAAIVNLASARLPQILLGSESQLLAFAAAAAGMQGRLCHAPVPEIFPGVASLEAACRAAGMPLMGGTGFVHLRFGGVRAARVIKGARNAAVIAEAASAPPLTASHHPFATGRILPDAVQHVFSYGQEIVRPFGILGREIPAAVLPATCLAADLPEAAGGAPAAKGAMPGLDIVSLGEFQADGWAAGPVRSPAGEARLRVAAKAAPDAVLVPWNLDHPGSIVPALLERLILLRDGQANRPQIVLLPFNYLGPTGIIRGLGVRLRDAAADPGGTLDNIFLARVTEPCGLAVLRRLSRVAWVDGNDPEAWWTLQRLAAVGVRAILIDPGAVADGTLLLAADELLWVEADTRCGALTFAARMPSPRQLAGLLEMTASLGRADPRKVPFSRPAQARAPRRGRISVG